MSHSLELNIYLECLAVNKKSRELYDKKNNYKHFVVMRQWVCHS